ncbi:hypothetical protein, partial [Geomonas sp.]|uniref:hypothetical protein n=1 Tax=Geomonas sp. TaxID=2651584 RepID=UPI002B493666
MVHVVSMAAGAILLSLGPIIWEYRPPLDQLPLLLAKKLLTPLMSYVYRDDLVKAEEISGSYFHGADGRDAPAISWQRLAQRVPALKLMGGSGLEPLNREVHFVFEKPDVPFLKAFSDQRRLKELVGGAGEDEYRQMLALFRWLGTRWDHGTDTVPGNDMCCSPLEIVAAGEKGARFWCEVSARVTVDAAT